MSVLQKDKKRLLSNFFSLSALQAINMILPLVTFPYLVRVLGVDTFGLVNFVLAIIMLFNIVVSFGFELSATRYISIHQNNMKKVSEIFVSVFTIKIILLLITVFVLITLVYFVESFNSNAALYIVTFGLVIGNLMFPTWFFMGMEDMKYITYINVCIKLVFTVLVFVYVQDESDAIYVPLFNSIGSILAGLFSLLLLFKLYKLKLPAIKLLRVFMHLKQSYHYFFSRAANDGARHYAVTIIGVGFGTTAVGYYSIVEKLYYAFLSLGGVVSQTIYPYMNRTKNVRFFKKILYVVSGVGVIILIPLMVFNEYFFIFVFNIEDSTLSTMFILIFSGAIFGSIAALLGYPLLGAFGYSKEANNTLIYASLLYVAYISLVSFFEQDVFVVSFSIAIYSIFSFVLRAWYVKKYEILKRV